MPVAPVVGKLRKRLITDLTAAIGLGTAGGYIFWYTVHLPMMKKRDDYYLRLEQAKSS
ncbi:cytochrome c oxidase subunit 7 [Kwoniella heveanensis CBS 569]|uniref:Cytochrome c oxidase subunit 9, mitochondrial n=1 Tax=Kwoniella heveanensis BCC8398 TaxID=1296120 RepID=A0A1B9GP21_9TREE|nr:cytochrome c oxidase subunit 7 [Kwoniella heveanensis BCC8398]OCF44019.1 cytochrome c oxidase subunit 7 [Kwoniella heveanensis CBS 569]